MDSRELFIHLAIWPNVAWIVGIFAAMLWSRFDSRWDAEFMTPMQRTPVSVVEGEVVGAHRIDTVDIGKIRAVDATETSGK